MRIRLRFVLWPTRRAGTCIPLGTVVPLAVTLTESQSPAPLRAEHATREVDKQPYCVTVTVNVGPLDKLSRTPPSWWKVTP